MFLALYDERVTLISIKLTKTMSLHSPFEMFLFYQFQYQQIVHVNVLENVWHEFHMKGMFLECRIRIWSMAIKTAFYSLNPSKVFLIQS